MNRNLRDCLVAAGVASAVTFGLGGIYIARAEAQPALPGVEVCYEDQPCWDCTEKGNRVCGHPIEIIIGHPRVEVTTYPSFEDMMGGAIR